jgi:probable H4MPT-linked C1 transfer pathway protein
MHALGLDVGGANLKAAHTGGVALTRPFALWRDPAGLSDQLAQQLAELPPADVIGLTMTGELCDCYASKREGVAAILDAVQRAAGERAVRVWTTAGQFVSPEEARAEPLLAAASNWLALATVAGRLGPQGFSLLLDVGSTTTDVIPICDGRPVPRGRTDPERLRAGELLYAGVLRTPLCALLGLEGATELFATTGDALRVLGMLAEDPQDCNTADGQPATIAASHARLARMLCADLETSTPRERRQLAGRIRDILAIHLRAALTRGSMKLDLPLGRVFLAGSGSFLAEYVILQTEGLESVQIVDLAEEWGPDASIAACARAVAVLAAEEKRDGA